MNLFVCIQNINHNLFPGFYCQTFSFEIIHVYTEKGTSILANQISLSFCQQTCD